MVPREAFKEKEGQAIDQAPAVLLAATSLLRAGIEGVGFQAHQKCESSLRGVGVFAPTFKTIDGTEPSSNDAFRIAPFHLIRIRQQPKHLAQAALLVLRCRASVGHDS